MDISLLISLLFFVAVSGVKPVVKYEYEIKYIDVLIDHFSFVNNATFKLRYLVNDTYWDRKNGPIFFYTGNEGDIEMFAQNTGLIWEFAPQFNALIVFAEHRYYGNSMPFGKESLKKAEYYAYLTSEQALADFVDVIYRIKNYDHHCSCPEHNNSVIAFGGSYGGMLAAWMRMKYPSLIQGSLASSAPIWQFTGMIDCNDFYKVVSTIYNETNANCFVNIKNSWNMIKTFASTTNGTTWINENWKLCKPLRTNEDIDELNEWLENNYVSIAMINYPYPTNFLMPVPANPLKKLCEPLDKEIWSSDESLLNAIFEAMSVYFNYTGNARCLDWHNDPSSGLGTDGWNIQSCNEMVMPMCANDKSIFRPRPWNFESYSNYCYEKYKLRPRERMAEKVYGGKRIETASNIIFSNGKIDPWISGGVTIPIPQSEAVKVLVLSKSAHHLDLRASNVNDPSSVRKARNIYKTIFKHWIRNHKRRVLGISKNYYSYEEISNNMKWL